MINKTRYKYVNPSKFERLFQVGRTFFSRMGFADFDLIENPDTGEFLIMEINPCVRSAFKSGMDFATMIADATLGQPLRKYEYKLGKRLRHLGFDVLWFLKSPNRFKSKPSWFSFWGNDLYYQDLIMGDFKAFFWGTWGNFKKQMAPEFKKAKSGTEKPIKFENKITGGILTSGSIVLT